MGKLKSRSGWGVIGLLCLLNSVGTKGFHSLAIENPVSDVLAKVRHTKEDKPIYTVNSQDSYQNKVSLKTSDFYKEKRVINSTYDHVPKHFEISVVEGEEESENLLLQETLTTTESQNDTKRCHNVDKRDVEIGHERENAIKAVPSDASVHKECCNNDGRTRLVPSLQVNQDSNLVSVPERKESKETVNGFGSVTEVPGNDYGHLVIDTVISTGTVYPRPLQTAEISHRFERSINDIDGSLDFEAFEGRALSSDLFGLPSTAYFSVPPGFATYRGRKNNGRSDKQHDVDSIIKGIIKLLGGNVKLTAADDDDTRLTTFGGVDDSRVVTSTRINNRGPPRLPIFPFGLLPTPPQFTHPPIRPPITPPSPDSLQDGRPPYVANTRPPFLVPLPPALSPRPTHIHPDHASQQVIMPSDLNEDEYEDYIEDTPHETTVNENALLTTDATHTSAEEMQHPSSVQDVQVTPGDQNPILESEVVIRSSTQSTIVPTPTQSLDEEMSSVIELESSMSVSPATITFPSLTEHITPFSTAKNSTRQISSQMEVLRSTTLDVDATSPQSVESQMATESLHHNTTLESEGSDTVVPPDGLSTAHRLHPSSSHPAFPNSFLSSWPPAFESTRFGHPGIVLPDDPFMPGEIVTAAALPTYGHLPGDVFDVTVFASHGFGPATPAMDNFRQRQTLVTQGQGSQDGSVYIDGRKTYFNLFPTPATEHHQTTGIGYVIPEEELTGSGSFFGDDQLLQPQTFQSRPSENRPLPTRRPPYTKATTSKPSKAPAIRIDTCIVGDDSTCKRSGEVCRTVDDVSSCYCRPGTGRRRPRTPCEKSVLLHLSLKVDKIHGQRIEWNGNYGNPASREFQLLVYEAQNALDQTLGASGPVSSAYLGSTINKFYSLGGKVIVNSTVQLKHNPITSSTAIRGSLQRHLIRLIRANNNFIGNSVLAVDGPLNPVPEVSDVNECLDSQLHDCDQFATCENLFGSFTCVCLHGYTDRHEKDDEKAGRYCESCPTNYCKNGGECSIIESETLCACKESFYGSRCEIDGEVIAVAVGASVAAVVVIIITVIFLCMWSRRWEAQDRKTEILARRGGFGFFNGWWGRGPGDGFSVNVQHKGLTNRQYGVTLEDRIRWAHLAESMTPQNIYAVSPSEYASVGTLQSGVPAFAQQQFGLQHMSPPFINQAFGAPAYGQYGPPSLASASVGGISRAPTIGARTPVPLREGHGPMGGGIVGSAPPNDNSSEEDDKPYHLPRPKSRASVGVGSLICQQNRLARSYNSLLF